jgi:hypothetical protein
VERFMKVHTRDVKLKSDASEAKEQILSRIDKLRDEWPQMNADVEDKRKLDAECKLKNVV